MTTRRIVWIGSVIAMAVAVWLATGWVDDPPDATCGSVLRTDLWLDRDGCRSVMSTRLAVSAGLAAASVAGAAALVISRRRRDRGAPAAPSDRPAG